jgi:hypothetical protein
MRSQGLQTSAAWRRHAGSAGRRRSRISPTRLSISSGGGRGDFHGEAEASAWSIGGDWGRGESGAREGDDCGVEEEPVGTALHWMEATYPGGGWAGAGTTVPAAAGPRCVEGDGGAGRRSGDGLAISLRDHRPECGKAQTR